MTLPYQFAHDYLDAEGELLRRADYLEAVSAQMAADAKAIRQRLGRKASGGPRMHSATVGGLKVVRPSAPSSPPFYAVATRQDARYLEQAYRNQNRQPPAIVVLEDV